MGPWTINVCSIVMGLRTSTLMMGLYSNICSTVMGLWTSTLMMGLYSNICSIVMGFWTGMGVWVWSVKDFFFFGTCLWMVLSSDCYWPV